MTDTYSKVLVIGDGGWGTTLAFVLARQGVEVCLWSAFPEQAKELATHREIDLSDSKPNLKLTNIKIWDLLGP